MIFSTQITIKLIWTLSFHSFLMIIFHYDLSVTISGEVADTILPIWQAMSNKIQIHHKCVQYQLMWILVHAPNRSTHNDKPNINIRYKATSTNKHELKNLHDLTLHHHSTVNRTPKTPNIPNYTPIGIYRVGKWWWGRIITSTYLIYTAISTDTMQLTPHTNKYNHLILHLYLRHFTTQLEAL